MFIAHGDSQRGYKPDENDFKAGKVKGQQDRAKHPEWPAADILAASEEYSAIWLMNPDRALKRMNGYQAGAKYKQVLAEEASNEARKN
jgi:hypothetical protein